jgi:glutathione S-transferase
MVLYATQPKALSPADPCNKVTLLTKHSASGVFCHGDRPTIADICLVTQVTPAKTFNCPLDPYPRVLRIYDNCMAIPAFADAHPARQPDAE